MKQQLCNLKETVSWAVETLEQHPERDLAAAVKAVRGGASRRYPVVYVGYPHNPDDKWEFEHIFQLPELSIADNEERSCAEKILAMLRPLDMHNPIELVFNLGVGPGTFPAVLGAELSAECGMVAIPLPNIDSVIERIPVDWENSIEVVKMRQFIEFIKNHLPCRFKIAMPDSQGVFNIVHALLGDQAFFAPLDNPEKFDKLCSIVTNFLIEAHQKFKVWIGNEYLSTLNREIDYIAECSVNLVSADFYFEHLLKYDLLLAAELPEIHLHPCSGPHVFKATLENLPNLRVLEAGFVSCAVAGSIGVNEALTLMDNHPYWLKIGQELPAGREFETIITDLDRYRKNNRLTFGYTGMHWQRKDIPDIRNLHLKIDQYWDENIRKIQK